MWSYLTTRSFISLLPGYVENEVVPPKVLSLDEIVRLPARFDHIALVVKPKGYRAYRYTMARQHGAMARRANLEKAVESQSCFS